ncbi:flagellar hook-associated protein FlgK [Trujillonella endophytica]|uniref:Flagellar hook-associated protein 1 n=1 Tax=Trujillonella endophytica TaxID=673521 RepID=A0A1H8SH50_9ACTN|nr:flagellar hook-associated protein FlgK [Trujillella endophytica]SEO78080.1 flagellar hook-associated protein 1 FlgK [Trujillella endophytica]
MSTFSGLSRATTALWAAQRGMDVTGQNIANVNTDGYSRQRVELTALNGAVTPAIHAVSDGIGSGVDSNNVIRIRDAFLEARGRLESANSARLTVTSSALASIESAFREPGDTGIQSMLADVWAGFSDVANTPLVSAARGQVIERLQTLAAGVRSTATSLDKQWEDTRDALQTLVHDVNTTATSIADLNQKIQLATNGGLPANELADERDKLVSSLAASVGATSTAGEDGTVVVSVGGSTLVNGNVATAVRLDGATGSAGATADKPRLVMLPGGSRLQVGGTAEGQLAVLGDLIPQYLGGLDTFAQSLAGTLNTQHAAGFDLTGAPGGPLLGTPTGAGTITAANLTVRVTSPDRIAAAGVGPDGVTPSANGNNADAMYELSLDPGGVDAAYREMIVGLGVVSGVAKRDLAVQTVVRDQVDAARESVSGVNLDEEMTNMMSFQHAYSAAARMVTAIDEALETLIRSTGIVGR